MIRKIYKLSLVFLISVCILPFNKVSVYQDQHQNNMESTMDVRLSNSQRIHSAKSLFRVNTNT